MQHADWLKGNAEFLTSERPYDLLHDEEVSENIKNNFIFY